MKVGTLSNDRKRGFTIVELAVVIAVIAILATIVLVVYPGAQAHARDAERKSDLSQLSAALKAFALKKNNYMDGTDPSIKCGFLDTGNGWTALGPSDGGGYYPTASILTCLKNAGVIANESGFIDPSGCKSDTGVKCGQYLSAPTTAYMKATCTKNGSPVTYFMAHLETEPRRDAEVDALCDPNSVMFFNASSQKWGTNYGMNYYVTVK